MKQPSFWLASWRQIGHDCAIMPCQPLNVLSCLASALVGLTVAGRTTAEPRPKEIEVVVYGVTETSKGYAATHQVTATKAPKPIAEVPQSVTVVTSSQLRDTQARRTDDVLTLVPGVEWGAGFGGIWDDYYVRGSRVWAGTLYRNGWLSGYSGLGATDASQVNRIEVLRGPAAVLYGPSVPGGTVNIITVEPSFVARKRLSAGVGSFDTRRFTVDLTGPIRDGLAAFRFNASWEATDGPRGNDGSSRAVMAPMLLVQRGKLSALMETQIFDMRYRPDPIGVPAVDGDPWALPRTTSLIATNAPRTDFRGLLSRAELRYEATSKLTARFGVQRQAGFLREPATYSLGLRKNGYTLDRLATFMTTHAEDLAVRASFELRGHARLFEHELSGGVDARTERVDYTFAIADPSTTYAVDVRNPRASVNPWPTIPPAAAQNRWSYQVAGVWANETLHASRHVTATAALRVDAYQQTSVAAPEVNDTTGELAPSGRVGLVWAPVSTFSLYGNVSRGYWPVLGIAADSRLLHAERNLGTEIGARIASPRRRATLDIAGFALSNRDVTVPDPERPDFQTQRGASLTTGIEAYGTVSLGRPLRAMASYAFTRATVTADADPSRLGEPLPHVPNHSAGLWLLAQIPSGPFEGLKAGVGERITGSRHLDDGFLVPGYGRTDLLIGYGDRDFELSFRVDNVWDCRAIRSGTGELALLPEPPRNFMLTLGVQ